MKVISTILAGLLPVICMANTDQVHRIDPATGIETWETHSNGVTFSLTQILPDQARAFYVNRGFTLSQAEPYATACVYMAVLRNDTAPGVIHFVQQDWSIIAHGISKPPMKVNDWLARLKKADVKKSALLAFRWAQFPLEQDYEPGGDWNQGMLTTGLPAGSEFDAVARWNIGNNHYEGVLHNVRCAK